MPPTPPPFKGDFFIQSSHDARTSGIARVAPRSESASRFQFIARYFGDMGCASLTHQPPGSRRLSISAAHPTNGIRAFASRTSESVSLLPRSWVNARYRTDGWSGSSSQSRTLSRGTALAYFRALYSCRCCVAPAGGLDRDFAARSDALLGRKSDFEGVPLRGGAQRGRVRSPLNAADEVAALLLVRVLAADSDGLDSFQRVSDEPRHRNRAANELVRVIEDTILALDADCGRERESGRHHCGPFDQCDSSPVLDRDECMLSRPRASGHS